MSRLGILFAITDNELALLKQQNIDEMYGYMLEHIEDVYFSSEKAFFLNKAWEGIHYCINDGEWIEDHTTESSVIFGGEVLFDDNKHVITIKDHELVSKIVEYLCSVDLDEVIKNGSKKIYPKSYSLPLDDNNLSFLLAWSKGIKEFYMNAKERGLNVIFAVDI